MEWKDKEAYYRGKRQRRLENAGAVYRFLHSIEKKEEAEKQRDGNKREKRTAEGSKALYDDKGQV